MRSFVIILLAVFVYSLFHSILASLWVKARARAWFGLETERWYRLAFNAIAVVSLVPVLALPALLPDRNVYTIPFPWAYINLAIQGLAGLALIVGLWQTGLWSFLGIQQFLTPPKSDPPKLVVGGLYRWVRHPLYTAGLALIWFIPVMTTNLLALILGLSIYLVVGALFEERRLLVEHGEAYADYQRRTPMLIPTRFPR